MTKPLKPVEILLAIGLVATLGACEGPSIEGGETTENTAPTQEAVGEGGEGGATGNADVDYMSALGLMKGHLIVAKELMDEGEYEQAEPHIGHPVEELYGDVEDELSQRNVAEFKPQLNELHDLIKSTPEKPETKEAYTQALESIDEAIAVLPEAQLESPEFVLGVIDGLLATAGEEYEAAIADGKIVEIIEYQDSRGFVIYAEELYQGISEQVSQDNAEVGTQIESSLTELKKAWPTVNPPDAPIMTPEEVTKLIETIKENSQKVS